MFCKAGAVALNHEALCSARVELYFCRKFLGEKVNEKSAYYGEKNSVAEFAFVLISVAKKKLSTFIFI